MRSPRTNGPDLYCDMRAGEAAASMLNHGVAVCCYCGSTSHKAVAR